MNISDIAIKRPVFTTMVAIGLMVLGMFKFFTLGVDLFPDINFPVVTVTTVYPGAGPEEVEQLVSRPIEDALASVNGVDKLQSISREGVSTVFIVMKLEVDGQQAASDVRDKVARVRALLPKDVQDPVISRLDPGATPVALYTLSGDRSPRELREMAEDILKPGLESVDGVAVVNVSGGLQREIQVNLSLDRLKGLGMSPLQVTQIIAGENLDVPAGRFTLGDQEVAIRVKGQLRTVEEIANLPLPVPNRAPVRLKDVAEVVDGNKEQRTRNRVNGKSSVSFEVVKASGTNTVAIADGVRLRLAKLEGRLPNDVTITEIMDSSVFIRENAHEVNIAILYGGAMAILVIFLFMLDWRSTLISALALPVSVVTTFFVMGLLGFTLNMMTLLGLSLAIGLLIDDAVVVRENIFRHMELGETPMVAASKGTKEIALAVMATTFTIVAVFVPVAFTSGMIGQFFRQFGLTVTAAVLVSLFVAFTIDPMLSARLVKPLNHNQREDDLAHWFKGPVLRFLDAVDSTYREILAWSLQHRIQVATMATVLFFSSLYLVKFTGTEFFPKPDRGQFSVSVEMPAGTSIDKLDSTIRQAETSIQANPAFAYLYTTVGVNGDATKANIRIIAVDKKDRTQDLTGLKEEVRAKLLAIPGLKFSIFDQGLIEGTVESPIMLQIRGEDYGTLLPLSEEIRKIVESTPGATDVASSYVPGKPEYQIVLDRDRAADLGLSLAQLGLGLRNAVEGDTTNKMRVGDKEYDIRVRLADADRDSNALLRSYSFPSRMGRNVELSEVADIVPASGPAVIERLGRQRQITISAATLGRSLGEVVADIQTELDTLNVPEGYTVAFGGEAERMKESGAALGIALVLGIIFIYLVLASQFESFIHPFTIMFSLPLAVVGALLSLFLMGSPLGMSTFIGIILLMGLVTKNAILLVDYTNQLREEKGLDIIPALLEAGPTRLRPILMTSLAMVLGMLPTALSTGSGSEFRAPMAIAIIGGVITSTFLTLVVVPVVYTWMDRFTLRGWAQHKAKKAGAHAPPHPVPHGPVPGFHGLEETSLPVAPSLVHPSK